MTLRLGFVAGVTPTKWMRIWSERHPDLALEVFRTDEAEQLEPLRDGRADIAFVRLPIDSDGFSVIPLYREVPVVVVPEDHAIAAADAITLAELDGEERVTGTDLSMAMELVAAGVGVIVVPHSIARLHHRKDLTSRPVTDAEQTQIALVWLADRTTDGVEEFVGIVRGRTAHSSRTSPTPSSKPEKRAAAKAAAKGRDRKPARGGGGSASSNRARRGKR
ncbi:LysR substrate-binding domain-containing protein [Luethyella okanaganae]|uniref:LysR substrate-binding domain-containing protein n=1 Tax=Luethyella okanaganae TaxID=69372 RepID=A0ABW1VJ93_9MICO